MKEWDPSKSEKKKKKSTCTKQEYIVSSFHGSEKYANLDLAALSVHEHMLTPWIAPSPHL